MRTAKNPSGPTPEGSIPSSCDRRARHHHLTIYLRCSLTHDAHEQGIIGAEISCSHLPRSSLGRHLDPVPGSDASFDNSLSKGASSPLAPASSLRGGHARLAECRSFDRHRPSRHSSRWASSRRKFPGSVLGPVSPLPGRTRRPRARPPWRGLRPGSQGHPPLASGWHTLLPKRGPFGAQVASCSLKRSGLPMSLPR